MEAYEVSLDHLPDVALLLCFRAALSTPAAFSAAAVLDKRCLSIILASESNIWKGVAESVLDAQELALHAYISEQENHDHMVDFKALTLSCAQPSGLHMCRVFGPEDSMYMNVLCRSGGVACTLAQSLLVCCHGLGNMGLFDDASQPLLLDLVTMRWRTANVASLSATFPCPRLRASLTTLNGESALLFGGSFRQQYLGDMWLLHFGGHHSGKIDLLWEQLDSTPQALPRAHHAAVSLNTGREHLVVGGTSYEYSALPMQVEIFTVATRTVQRPSQSGEVPYPMTQNLAAVFNDPDTGASQRVFVIGGAQTTGLSERFRGPTVTFALELSTMSWSRLTSNQFAPPISGRSAGCTMGGGRWFLVMGGDTGGHLFPEPRLFDLKAAAWQALPPMRMPQRPASGMSDGDARPAREDSSACAGHALSSGVLIGGYALDGRGRLTGPVARLEICTLTRILARGRGTGCCVE